MWILKVLTGPLAGQTYPIRKSPTLLGRAPHCDIKIPSANVSKEHTRIEVFDDKVILSDAGSRNGTFLNGVQIRTAKARSGDRFAMHDMIFEIQQVGDHWQPQHIMQQSYGNAAVQSYQAQSQQMEAAAPQESPPALARVPEWIEKANNFIDREVLPGVFKLPEMFEFRWVLAGFMALFILVVTSLSTIPLIRILKMSLEEESQQHALTIATTLARVNRAALMQGIDSSVSVDIATSRPGVKRAMILSNVDGNIIAPAALAGTYPDLPYIHEGRRLNKETVKQIDDNTVVAMVPIEFYNAETGTQAITAYAAVFFDMSSIAVDSAQVLGLFITTLFIAMLVGAIVFYFLYKIVENPFRSLNTQLDQALKDGQDSVTVNYRFPALQTLANNISSTLTRANNGSEGNGNKAVEHDRNREITNLIELIGFAAMGIHQHDLTIAAINQSFESRSGITAAQAASMTVGEISDQALKLSIKDLIERIDASPDELATNELEFGGADFNVVAQGIYGTNKIAYYLIVLLPSGDES
jgi:hypothetical protein